MSLSIESQGLHLSTTRPKSSLLTILLSLKTRRIIITSEEVTIIHFHMAMDMDESIQ